MKKTLNNLISELRAIVDSHYFFNGFYYGDILDVMSSNQDKEYPALFCNIRQGGSEEFHELFEIELFSFDKVTDDHKEIQEVESDTIRHIRDILNVVRYSNRWQKFSDIRTSTAITRKYIDRTKDKITGWGITFTVAVESKYGICDLPLLDYDYDGDYTPSCADVRIYEDGILVALIPAGGEYSYTCGGVIFYDIYANSSLMYENAEAGDNIYFNTDLMRAI